MVFSFLKHPFPASILTASGPSAYTICNDVYVEILFSFLSHSWDMMPNTIRDVSTLYLMVVVTYSFITFWVRCQCSSQVINCTWMRNVLFNIMNVKTKFSSSNLCFVEFFRDEAKA